MASQNYHIAVTLGTVSANPILFNIILDYGSGFGSAVLKNFSYNSGASVETHGQANNYDGSFASGSVTMGVNPNMQSQVMANAVGTLTTFSFDVAFTGTPWWTFQILDAAGNEIISNLPDRPSIFGWINGQNGWSTSPQAQGTGGNSAFTTQITPA